MPPSLSVLRSRPFLQLLPSSARTVAGNGEAVDLLALIGGDWTGVLPPMLRVQVQTTAISGASATLTVFMEDSLDGGVTWNPIAATAGLTTITRVVVVSGIRGDAYPANFSWPFNAQRVRVRWTLSGTTPSVTFDVKAVLL